jgi:hypothetical protein
MDRIAFLGSVAVLAVSPALAEGNEETLEKVRSLVTASFEDEIADKLPESFRKSGLAPSDQERVIEQLADDYVDCFQDAIVEYAATNEIALSDLVATDGSVSFKGDSGTDFNELLVPCIDAARQAARLIE